MKQKKKYQIGGVIAPQLPKYINGQDNNNQIKSSATLILMPATLITQWKNEVYKHFAGNFSDFTQLNSLLQSINKIS